MTDYQRLQLRASEIRSRLAELAKSEEPDNETRSEIETLRTEYVTNETRQSALLIAGDVPVPIETRTEDAELQGLITRSNVGELFDDLLNHRNPTGAMAELQQHAGIEGNQVPLAMIRGELETRAVSPAPSDVGQNQSEIIPYVFPDSAHAFLGIDTPTVAVGESVYPVLTKTLDVRTPAEGADADETTGAFSADVLSPSRIQASFFYSREDRARFRGMDSALRQNLNEGLSDGLDDQILTGANGLLTGTNLDNHNVSTVTTFDDYVSHFGYDRVDGRFASSAADIRIAVGTGTYSHAGKVYRHATSVDRTALDRLMDITSGVRVSAHVPAVASNKQNSIIRRGMRRDMVAPIWEGITLIPDEITKAKQGQITITAVMLHAVKILRAEGFYKQQTQHA